MKVENCILIAFGNLEVETGVNLRNEMELRVFTKASQFELNFCSVEFFTFVRIESLKNLITVL